MKKSALICLFVLALCPLVAEEDEATAVEEENKLSLSVTTDFAYYPKSQFKAGATHFSPITDIYKTVAAQSVFRAEYRLPVWNSTNPLFKSNNIVLEAGLGITPCSFYPQVKATFTPVAFMNAYVGFKTGTGWNFGNVHGLARYDEETDSYEKLDSFSAQYMYGSVGMTWMFDTAAVWPGDWHHIVMLANYELAYECLNGTSATIWEWETKKGLADGWIIKRYFVIGYQMPLFLSMVAWQVTMTAHLNGTDYGKYAEKYNGDYTLIDMGPALEFSFGKQDEFYVVASFRARRSFSEAHSDYGQEPKLTQVGREWILDYMALRWKHIFK